MQEVACGLVFLHLLSDVVDGIDDVGRLAVAVKFADGMSLEIEPVGLLLRTCIPSFVKFEVTFPPFQKGIGLLNEFLPLVRVYAIGELLQCQTASWQYVAVAVCHSVFFDVVFHHDEVTHVQGLSHHLVEFGMSAAGCDDVASCQPDEEPHDAQKSQDAGGDVKPVRVRLFFNTLGVEPPVLDEGNLSALFQS